MVEPSSAELAAELAFLAEQGRADRRHRAPWRALEAWTVAGRLLEARAPIGPVLEAAHALDGVPDAARTLLARRLLDHAQRAARHVGIGHAPLPRPIDFTAWDLRLAEYVDGLGEYGRAAGDRLRAKHADRLAALPTSAQPTLPGFVGPSDGPFLALWDDPDHAGPPRWLRALADVVWNVEVRAEAEREDKTVSPALPLPLHRRTVDALRPHRIEDGRLVSGGIPLVPVVGLDALNQRGLAALGTVAARRLVHWFVRTLWARHNAGDRSNAVSLVGGFAALAAEIEMGSSNKTIAELPALLDAMVGTRVEWDNPSSRGMAPMLAGWELRKAAPGRKAMLHLQLSMLWAPGLVHELRGPEARLVPSTDAPVHVIAPVLAAAEARLHDLGVHELAIGARDLVTHGGVRIDWVRLAGESGVPADKLNAVLEAWVSAGAWARVGADRWALVGEQNAAANALLRQWADRSLEGQRARAKRAPKGPRKPKA